MESSNEIDLTLKLSTKIVQEEMEITYGRENSLQSLLEELPCNSQLELDKLEVALLDPYSLEPCDAIETKYFSKTLNALNLEDGDILLIKDASMSDSKKREQGKVYFLNSTAYEWMIKLYPNQDRVTEVAGKKVQFGVGVPGVGSLIPGVGEIGLANVGYATENVPIALGSVEKNESSITIKPHQKTQIPYTNYMPKHKPLPVRVHFQNSSTKFKEIRAMENGEAMILTGDGLMVGKTVKNMYTRRTKATWNLKDPPSHNKNVSFDPHKSIVAGTKCDVCGL